MVSGGGRMTMSKQKGCVLIIDNQPNDIKTVTMTLERAGYEVISAFNGQDGITKARKGKPAAIILDIDIAGENGFDTARTLRSDADSSMIPIIILTALENSPAPLGRSPEGA